MTPARATFTQAHRAWLKAQERYVEIAYSSENYPQPVYDRLVDRRSEARRAGTKRLAAMRAQDVNQLSAKIGALWAIATCDYRNEAAAVRFGFNFGDEEIGLFKSIRRDAAALAKMK